MTALPTAKPRPYDPLLKTLRETFAFAAYAEEAQHRKSSQALLAKELLHVYGFLGSVGGEGCLNGGPMQGSKLFGLHTVKCGTVTCTDCHKECSALKRGARTYRIGSQSTGDIVYLARKKSRVPVRSGSRLPGRGGGVPGGWKRIHIKSRGWRLVLRHTTSPQDSLSSRSRRDTTRFWACQKAFQLRALNPHSRAIPTPASVKGPARQNRSLRHSER